MLKKHIDAKLGIVFISLVLILSIFALMLLNGSVAWLANSINADANGMKVSVKSDMSVIATLKSHPVTKIDGNDYTIPSRDIESYEIPTHDPNGISYSEYKKALAVIITVDAHVDSTVSIVLHRDETSGVETITTPGLSNYISNCIKITPATIAEDGTVATKGAALATPTFVNLSTDPVTKSEDIKLVEHAPVYEGEVNEFCFIIEYDAGLLAYIEQKIIEQHLADNEVSYLNDIKFLIFE